MDDDLERALENLPPAVKAFVDALIAENARLRAEIAELKRHPRRATATIASEEDHIAEGLPAVKTPRYPDSVMLVSITRRGLAKRTPINAYTAQRRGGIGVYDIEAAEADPVRLLAVADASMSLLIVTSRSRAFRVPVEAIRETGIHGRGAPVLGSPGLTSGEEVAAVAVLDDNDPRPQLFIATERGWIRRLHRNYLGPNLQPGTLLYDPREGGGPAALAWFDEESDVFMVSRLGIGIRFAQKGIPVRGALGMRLRPGDAVAGLCAVADDDPVLLVSRDGKAARRRMAAFAAQGPGGQGKIAMKAEDVVCAMVAHEADEVFCISEGGKIIRFPAAEIPSRPSAVQGVAAMELVRDRIASVVVSSPPREG